MSNNIMNEEAISNIIRKFGKIYALKYFIARIPKIADNSFRIIEGGNEKKNTLNIEYLFRLAK